MLTWISRFDSISEVYGSGGFDQRPLEDSNLLKLSVLKSSGMIWNVYQPHLRAYQTPLRKSDIPATFRKHSRASQTRKEIKL